jgi:hypothetical protein
MEPIAILVAEKLPDVNLFVAENGQAGLAAFRKHLSDIVVTDLQMQVMDGILMAREIKESNKETRLIITTAVNDINRVLKAIDIGINHYLLKPIDYDKLLATTYAA